LADAPALADQDDATLNSRPAVQFRAAIALLDVTYGAALGPQTLSRPVLQIYKAVLLAFVRRNLLFDVNDLRFFSWLEFAPALLGGFPHREKARDGDAVVANMVMLSQIEKATFERMALRMDLPADGLYACWNHVVATSFANLAFNNTNDAYQERRRTKTETGKCQSTRSFVV
jgi:hypothetical protein